MHKKTGIEIGCSQESVMKTNVKAIRIADSKVIDLVSRQAALENRSLANMASTIILGVLNRKDDDRGGCSQCQAKKME